MASLVSLLLRRSTPRLLAAAAGGEATTAASSSNSKGAMGVGGFVDGVRKFGNPWMDDYPKFIWRSLRYSRSDKDTFDPLYRLLNRTGIYEHVLKSNWSYWTFVMVGGIGTTWLWSEGWNKYWCQVNKGKLYHDNPYSYPVEDDDE